MKFIKNIAFAAFLTIGAFSAVMYTSCTKDACKDVTCQNGGTCSGGTCTCPTGVGGTNCATIFRTTYTNTYKGNGTDNAGGTYNNFRLSFATTGTDLTKMTVTVQDASSAGVGVPVLNITLSNLTTTGSSFTVESATATSAGITYTYTGSGSISGTSATLSLIETPSVGAAVTYSFTNFAKQ
jgi:hypothetical protein